MVWVVYEWCFWGCRCGGGVYEVIVGSRYFRWWVLYMVCDEEVLVG